MSRRSLPAGVAFSTLSLTVVAPLVAAAAEAEEAHAASIGDLVFPAINFAIFAVILVGYVIPAMREYLRRRAEDAANAAAAARTALAEAEAAIGAVRTRAGGVAKERDAIRDDLVAAATRQAERIRQQAEETGKRRLADAGLVAEQERRRALLEVRAEIAALATAQAESRLRATVSSDDQRSFAQQFLKDAPTQ